MRNLQKALNLQKIINTPGHAERLGMLEWLEMDAGQTWDEHFFDVENTKKKVAKL